MKRNSYLAITFLLLIGGLFFLLENNTQPTFEFKSIDTIDESDHAISAHSNCETVKTWKFQGDINDKYCEFLYSIKFAKRWINQKSQWIPISGTCGQNANSDLEFHLTPYSPKITFEQNKEGWIRYRIDLNIIIANALKDEFWINSNLNYDYFTFSTELDTIVNTKIPAMEFPRMDYQNIDTTNMAFISKVLYCENEYNKLRLEDSRDTKNSFKKLLALRGMGGINIESYSNFGDSIPNRTPTRAGAVEYVLLIKNSKVGAFKHYCFDLNEWEKFKRRKNLEYHGTQKQ